MIEKMYTVKIKMVSEYDDDEDEFDKQVGLLVNRMMDREHYEINNIKIKYIGVINDKFVNCYEVPK